MARNPSPIGVGRGQAQVLNVPRATKYVDKKGNAQRAANIQAAKDQETALNKMLDVNFDMGWQEQDNQIQSEADNYRNKIIGWYKQNGDMNDSDFQRVVKAEQERIGLLTRKSLADKEVYKGVLSEIDKDSRYNKEAARRNLNKTIYNYDKDGKRLGAKGIWDINSEDSFNTLKDPSGYNMTKVFKGMLADLPSKIDNVINESNLQGADGSITLQQREKFKGKAFTLVNGKMVLDIYSKDQERRSASRDLALQDEMFKNYYDKQIENGATEDEAFKELGAYLGSSVGRIETSTTKNTPTGGKGSGGLSKTNFDNAIKYKEQVTKIVGGDLEFYNAKDVKRVRGRDLPLKAKGFVQNVSEDGMYDVLYTVNAKGKQVIKDVVDFTNMDSARETIGRNTKFLQRPTASELEKTPPYIPEGANKDNLARSEWLYTNPNQFDVTPQEKAQLREKEYTALIEDSNKQVGQGEEGAKKLTETLKGRKYKGKTVDKVEKRTIAKSGWQIIKFTDGSQIIIGGQAGNDGVIEEIIRGGVVDNDPFGGILKSK